IPAWPRLRTAISAASRVLKMWAWVSFVLALLLDMLSPEVLAAHRGRASQEYSCSLGLLGCADVMERLRGMLRFRLRRRPPARWRSGPACAGRRRGHLAR